MKKNGILNRDINAILGYLGHTDQIVIADCGLPIPDDVYCVDLSLKLGTPSFLEVLEIIKEEMKVELVIIADEIVDHNSKVYKAIESYFDDIELVSHSEFKELSKSAKMIIRTGEMTPYANIILQSGVIF